MPLSRAASEVLAIIALRQPIARSASSSSVARERQCLDTLLQRGLVEHNSHRLLVSTRAFLEILDLRGVADLPPLPTLHPERLEGVAVG